MDEPKSPLPRLVPARPDLGEAKRSGFLPRVPFRFVALTAALLAAVVLGFNWRQAQRAAALRAEIRALHTGELKSLRRSYEASLAKLAALISAAASGPVENFVDPSLQLEALRDEPGLYLRLPLRQADTPEQIATAARAMQPDWIPGCLGLSPTTARELYEIGAFLLPSFVASLDAEDVMQLRVRKETLEHRMKADLASLRAAIDASWLMLVLQEGPSRSEQPVRVFIWDLPHAQLLLRARVRSQGILLTSRILSQGVRAGASATKPGAHSAAAANDCSIAAALKKRLASQHTAQ